jgi:aminopeptidase N
MLRKNSKVWATMLRSYKSVLHEAKQILALDKRNPQIAARLLTLMNNWRMFDAPRRKMALKSLKSIAATKGLSRDTQEIVDRMIG